MTLREHIDITRRTAKILAKEQRGTLSAIFASSVASATKGFIPLYFSAEIIDALVKNEPVEHILFLVALTVGLTFLFELIAHFLSGLSTKFINRSWRCEQWRYAEKAMSMDYEDIESAEVKLLREQIKRDSQTGFNFFYYYRTVGGTVGAIVQIIGSLALTLGFFASDGISTIAKAAILVGIAVNVICTTLVGRRKSQLTEEFYSKAIRYNILSDRFYSYIEDYSSGKDVRIYAMGDWLTRDFHKNVRYLFDLFGKTELKKELISLPDTILNECVRFGVYIVLIAGAIGGNVTVGSIAKYAGCIAVFVSAVQTLAVELERGFANNHYLKRYFSYFDIPKRMYDGSLTVEKRDDGDYSIEFRNVSFKYPGSDTWALRNVNFTFKIGERLAIVGKNGSGKTTFIKLLCRLYDPTEGEILLNGIDVRKYDRTEYMTLLSVVFQDFRLLAFPLGQNVAASREYDRERVIDSLERAGFSDRLASMSDGLETCLYKNWSKEGVEISGGEAQKIALARALCKKAPFIILDEPTAALDPVAEFEVYSHFASLTEGRTAVLISHRLASCRFCERIAVFDQGKIIALGDHESLYASGTLYRSLWDAQAQYYVAKNN